MNPVFIREIRQAVRNRTVLYAINIFLTILVLASGYVIYDTGYGDFAGNPDQLETGPHGQRLFDVLMGLATIASAAGCISGSALRLAKDRIDEEMQFYSLIGPGKQLRGRMLAGLLITSLFFSITLPFLVFAYLLRGVSLYQIVLLPCAAMIGIQIANLIAIALFGGVRSCLQWICYGFLFAGILALLYIGLSQDAAFFHRLIRDWISGYMIPYTRVELATLFLFRSGFYLILIPFIAVLVALCQLSPPSWNRMRPLRVGLSVFGLVMLPVEHFFIPGGVESWFSFTTAALSVFLVVAVCERDTWEARLRRSIPKSRRGRIVAFPFFTGAANGLMFVLVWTILLAVIGSCYAFAAAGILPLPGGRGVNHFFVYSQLASMFFLMLIFDYFATGKMLWHLFFHRWLPKELTWLVGLGMILAASILSLVLAILSQVVSTAGHINNTFVMAVNPFMLFFDPAMTGVQMVLAGGWTIIIALCGYPWLRNRFLDFHLDSRRETDTLETPGHGNTAFAVLPSTESS
ncbi:MAG TPA: hypothetical protein DEB39_04795 [Planctomycetaceae bacterium]|nr:hypothetical protein [Planctomycetaceae bacterium]